jgi:hypothetical protein
MAAADTLEQWFKETAPNVEQRNERLGFGVFRRHDDGPNPVDYYLRIENLPLASFFQELVPSPTFMPVLDEALQPYRQALLAALGPLPQPLQQFPGDMGGGLQG